MQVHTCFFNSAYKAENIVKKSHSEIKYSSTK